MSSIGVRNKIASFEQHNELIRKTAIPGSSSQPSSEAGGSGTATSTTSKASESRRSRIQRQQGVATQQQQDSSSPKTPEEGGLRERRRARQQQQRERLAQTTTGNSSNRGPSKKSSRESNAGGQRSSRSSRRAVSTSISTESDEGAEHLQTLRMSRSPRDDKLAKVKKKHRMRRSRSPPKRRAEPVMMKESDSYFNNLLSPRAVDDDALTETSVRKIMKDDDQRQRQHRSPQPILARASSSSFDTEGGSMNGPPATNTATSSFLLSQTNSSSKYTQVEDDGTYDYGNREDDQGSQASITYEQRKQMERKAEEEKAKKESNNENSGLLNEGDVEFISKSLDTPAAKVAGGVVAAASIGAIVLGPVGLLVGAAAVGLGVGFLQIPEEQRTQAVKKAQESAINASEKLTSTCAASCHDAGVTEHVPDEITQCFSAPDGEGNDLKDDDQELNQNEQKDGLTPKETENGQGAKKPQQMNGGERRKPPSSPTRAGKRRAAVLRPGEITPLSQIYSLAPNKQPKAWLDVMASAETTQEEKSEALEEIIILAKDKRHARFFLEEGILDSLMWIMNPSLETTHRLEVPLDQVHIQRGAICCTTLGKAHCAAVHTGGDLLLMSMYERGSVPEERQLAQMLYEVPHHVQVAKTADEDSFVLKNLTMPQAEELAKSITVLANGQQQPAP